MATMRRIPYRAGHVIGERTVLEGPQLRPASKGPHARLEQHYLCRCGCGTESWILRRTLERGEADRCNRCRWARQRKVRQERGEPTRMSRDQANAKCRQLRKMLALALRAYGGVEVLEPETVAEMQREAA